MQGDEEVLMGLLGKLFEKKYCAVCGTELGLLGKARIADGHLCKECSGKLSPYFEGRRSATTDQIIEQLAYREQNKEAVAAFNPTRTLGIDTKVYVDEDAGKVIVTRSENWREENPDVFGYEQITGCDFNVDESRTELKRTNSKGERISYSPPRYEYSYSFYVTIHINHPYVSKIRFKLNRNKIEQYGSAEYRSAEDNAIQIRDKLTSLHEHVREAKAPKVATQCPHCLATTIPDANGCCEYCGSALS